MSHRAAAQRWRKHAKDARTMASEMTAKTNQETLLRIAAQYERLAEQADQREKVAHEKH
jgi:hypothetical protein